MSDLFTYPHAPGWKARETSREAAESIGCAATLRQLAYALITVKSRTADEIAGALDKSVLSIRPRVAELARLGKVEDSGERRHNRSGKRAIVWRVKG